MINSLSDIGTRLRLERQRLGLSQRKLGKYGGVEPNAQGKYENGARFPDSRYCMSIAKAGVDLLFVLTGTETPIYSEDLTEEEEELILDLRSLSRTDQDAIMRVTTSLAELITHTEH